jgi:hypothetical protein
MASLKASIFFKFQFERCGFSIPQIEPAVDPYVGKRPLAWFVTRTPLKKTFYPRKIEGFCKLLMLYFVLYFFGNAVFLQQVLYFCAVVSVVKCRTNSSKIPLRGSLEKDETNESLKISLSVVFIAQRLARLAGTMGSAPEEPSSSVATGGSDETGVSGKGTSGTCHVCGGALRRGNPSLARQCVTCKTGYHASDCGKRRSNAGYGKPYDVCPKVRRAFRLA